MEVQLKKLRKSAGLSQQQMADLLDIKVTRYRTWESGNRMLSLQQAYDCAVILGCSIDAIAGYEPPVAYSDPGQEALNGYWESMNDEGRERLLGIAELAADSGKVRVQKKTGDVRVPPQVGRSA